MLQHKKLHKNWICSTRCGGDRLHVRFSLDKWCTVSCKDHDTCNVQMPTWESKNSRLPLQRFYYANAAFSPKTALQNGDIPKKQSLHIKNISIYIYIFYIYNIYIYISMICQIGNVSNSNEYSFGEDLIRSFTLLRSRTIDVTMVPWKSPEVRETPLDRR